MTSYNVYEKLYNNTRSHFMIVKGDEEFTLGEYMLMRAGKKSAKTTKTTSNTTKAVSAFISYVNDKLTIKTPPARDKTIKKFPMRTSLAAFLSAVLVSALALSFALFSAGNFAMTSPTGGVPETEDVEENEIPEINE